MLAEFVDRIAGMATRAAAVEILDHPDPTKRYIRNGGSLQVVDIPPAPRHHHVDGFGDIVRMARNVAKNPQIFFDAVAVHLILDAETRREIVELKLETTHHFANIRLLTQARSMSVRDAVRFLTLDLADADLDDVIEAISRVDFKRTSSGSASASHGKESLGRSVEAECQNAAGIPKRFSVTVPIWRNPGFRGYFATVDIAVFLDATAETIVFRVVPDSVETSFVKATDSIGSDLREALPEVEIFQGSME